MNSILYISIQFLRIWAIAHLRGKTRMRPARFQKVAMSRNSPLLLKQGEKSADNCNLGYVQILTPTIMDTHTYIVWSNSDWLKKRQVTSQIVPPTNPGAYGGTTHRLLEAHKAKQLAWKRYKPAQSATKKLIMHAFKDYHFLELQDENGDIVGYSAIELFDHLMEQYVQPEDIADQITALHKILEQSYDPNEEPQVYYKSVQDAKHSLESLNETIDDSTLIRHGLNQFKEHIDLKSDIKAWKKLARTEKNVETVQITLH
jgi:hypothetical protein